MRQHYASQEKTMSKSIMNKSNLHLAALNRHQNIEAARCKYLNLSLNPKHASSKQQSISESLKKKFSDQIDKPNTPKYEIYFNRTKKYNYMKQIIDKYFQEHKKEKQINPEDMGKHFQTIIPNIYKRDQNTKSEIIQNKNTNRLYLISKRKNKTVIAIQEDLKNSLQKTKELDQTDDHLTKSISFTSSKSGNILPPIDQMYEDRDDQIHQFRYNSISILNESTIDPLKEEKILIADNEIYSIYMAFANGKPTYKIKEFKQKGKQILNRQIKAHHMNVESIWRQYRYDPKCLITTSSKPIKDLLFKLRRMDADSKFYTFKAKKYYKRLTTNNCQQLIRIVREFCEFMKQFQGKILNNKINVSNLYINKLENWRLGEWGFSSFKQTHVIQNMEFQNRIEPIIKSQKEWFVPPEYLSPEILKAIILSEDVDLMSFGSSPDIWSLGVSLLQILTIIPVWIPQKCVIYGKEIPSRQGILAVGDRDLKKLLKRQEKLPFLATKLIEQQYADQNFNNKLLQIIYKCLEYNPKNRPSYGQIIEALK